MTGPLALRLLVRLLPRDLRAHAGDDICRQFADERAQIAGRPLRIAALWIRTASDLSQQGLAERVHGPLAPSAVEQHVMTSSDSPSSVRAWWDGVRWDARVGVRRLLRAPGFTAITVVTLALGIGANCAIFSIRVALGADRRAVTVLVLRQAMLISTIGIAIGLGCSLGLTRLMTTMLFDLTPTDAPTFTLVGVGLLSVALVAAWWPIRRASPSTRSARSAGTSKLQI